MNIIKTSLILLCIWIMSSLQQEDHTGNYANAFGEQVTLLPNQTFTYTWHFDMASSWSSGQWTVKHDTLKLHIIPVYDTLELSDNDNKYIKDTFVLSADKKPERINNMTYITQLLTSGGQCRKLPDTRYYIRDNKLIVIKDGKPQTKKIKNLTAKKHHSWFEKTGVK